MKFYQTPATKSIDPEFAAPATAVNLEVKTS